MLRLENVSMFQLHSTEDVLAETLYRLRRKYQKWVGVNTLTEALTDAGCPNFAARVQGHLRTLSGPTAATHPAVLPD